MGNRLTWLLFGTTTVVYVAMVIWALSAGYSDPAGLLWVFVMVPVFLIAGAVLLRLRPENRIGRLLTLGALTMFAIPTILEIPTVIAFDRSGIQGWMWAPMWLVMTMNAVAVVLMSWLIVLLPNGEFRYPRERRLLLPAWIIVILPTLSLLSNELVITHSQAFPGVENVASPLVVPALASLRGLFSNLSTISFSIFLVAIVMQVMRYRRAAIHERKQVRWVLYAGCMAILIGVVPFAVAEFSGMEPLGHTLIAGLFQLVPFIIFPASVVVAVLEPRWVDVDIVIRKSFVYGALSFAILLLYVGIAAAAGVAAGARLPIETAIVLTVIVALLFQPARRRLQIVADKWVFGVRPTKYEAVAEFGETIDQASDPTELLPQLVGTLKAAIGLRWARATLDDGNSAETGEVDDDIGLSVFIGTSEDTIGTIECGPKTAGSFDDDDTQLVNTLAGQVGLAVMNARLAGRIVNAAEAERRRIERNIHDGAQQELVALVARLGMARKAASAGDLTPGQVDELQAEARQILTDLRELAQGIHPSVLTDGGILEAVEDRCSRLPIEVSIKATPGLRSQRFDDDVEGAAYFFIAESLTNVLKHAEATHAEVSLSQNNGRLLLTVTDDGRGFEPGFGRTTGLAGLRDRISALGGVVTVSSKPLVGTRVSATLPVGLTL